MDGARISPGQGLDDIDREIISGGAQAVCNALQLFLA